MDNVHFSLRPGTTYTMACEAVSVYALTVTVVTQEGEAVETFALQPGEIRQWAGDYTHLILSSQGDAVWSIVPVTRASAPCWHSRPRTAPGVTVDTQYNPDSINPQAGTAVAQALAQAEGMTVDAAYDPASGNAQSGAAVAQAAGRATADAVSAAEAMLAMPQAAAYATPEGAANALTHIIELDARHVPEGELTAISVQARSAGNPSTYSYLGLWELGEDGAAWDYLGSSVNAPGQSAGQAAVWQFEGVTLHGRKLRILAQSAPGGGYEEGPDLGIRTTTTPTGDATVCVRGGTYRFLPQLVIEYAGRTARFAPAAHVGDSTHLTEAERAGLEAWLAHKDELLALLD